MDSASAISGMTLLIGSVAVLLAGRRRAMNLA